MKKPLIAVAVIIIVSVVAYCIYARLNPYPAGTGNRAVTKKIQVGGAWRVMLDAFIGTRSGEIIYSPGLEGVLAGERDTLIRLSEETRKHPEVDIFVIRRGDGWYHPMFSDGELRKGKIVYDRRTGILESSADSNMYPRLAHVTDEAIRKVATKNGILKDLLKYGCKDVSL